MKVTRDRKLRWTIPIILFFSIIFDSALPAVFPREFVGEGQHIVSHLMLLWVVSFAFYFKDQDILWYSLLFGIIAELYNGTLVGLYMTGYWLVAFIVMKTKRYFPKYAMIYFMLLLLAIVFLDTAVFIFYHETGITAVPITRYVVDNLVPTMIFNTVLYFVMYFPMRSLLTWLGYEKHYIV